MRIALFLIVILAVASSMTLQEKYPINFSNKRSIMTLLTQVESQLKSGGPLDAITALLSEFKTTVNEEQANHDGLWAEQQEECADELSFREEEVKNAKASLQEAQETLDGCTSQKVRAEGDLAITKKQLSENRAYLAQVVDTRRRQAYAFETFATAFQFATQAIDEALVILEEIWSGDATFLQLTRHCNGLLKEAVKAKRAHQMTGVLSALVQLANKDVQADDELLNRVKSLFENLRSKLETQFQEASAAEQAAIEFYTEEKARLEATIAALEAQQRGLEAEIQELNKCIVTQQSIVVSASLKESRNQRLLNDATNLCEAVEEEYNVATAARSEELELLDVITQRVEARFADIEGSAKTRGMQDTFEYDNQNDYEQQEFVPSN